MLDDDGLLTPRPFLVPLPQTNDRSHTVAAQWSSFDEILDKFEDERQALAWVEEDLEMQ